jgi:NAD(P)-dependent dehydrogenase (short-subunit alcohol dehydrogenase family)
VAASTPDLSGKVALVTGASRGLGRDMGVALAAAGATVVAAARSRPKLEETVAAIGAEGGRGEAVELDVSQEAQVVAGIEAIVREHGRLDVVVNNAGVVPHEPALETTLDSMRETFEVNVFGLFAVARESARAMAEGGGGTIVNVSSAAATASTPGTAAYASSKAAVAHLTRLLAVEWAPHGITVNALAPGYFPSDVTAQAFADEELSARLLRGVPLRRFGSPGDIGAAVCYLASPAAAYMTGAVLAVDGGYAVAR